MHAPEPAHATSRQTARQAQARRAQAGAATRVATPGETAGNSRPGKLVAMALLAIVLLAGACSGGDDKTAARSDGPARAQSAGTPLLHDRDDPLPQVIPTPQSIRWVGPDVVVPATVDVITSSQVDRHTQSLIIDVIKGAGATDVSAATVDNQTGQADGTDAADAGDRSDVDARDPAPMTVRVGMAGDPTIAAALDAAQLDVPAELPAEGYALAALTRDDETATVVISAADPAGAYYGAQTLRELTRGDRIAGVGIVDHPATALRGTVEGFYGEPWSHAERVDQLELYGQLKFNTFLYAPKADPFHRDHWREPYPADQLDDLRELIHVADANHVRLTFAVSPGVSICFSDPSDSAALIGKLRAVHALGVRSFSIALDDIEHARWHCEGDAQRYGPPSTEAAAEAQVELLNKVKRNFIDTHEGVHPLQTVPTEYHTTKDSPYLQVLRNGLDPSIEIMWTGHMVVPAEITVADAQAAAEIYGRPPFIWDNTPVNDFPATEGRLLLGPYTRREAGLGEHVRGLVLNPMNQAAASKVALVGGADFAWNDTAYDPTRAHHAAAEMLADGDPTTVDALLAFFDVETLAPTSALDGRLSQPQAPELAAQLDELRSTWAAGDRSGAVAGLRPYADRLAGAPARIRAGVDEAFVAESAPWLDATELWGQALLTTLDALDARVAGDDPRATALFADADDLVARAGAIETIPGATFQQGPVRVADGVLDTFLHDAHDLR